MGIRGNEIQNNLWDYHPHDEEEDDDPTDIEYSQLEPNDRYRGGYWYYRQPFGRYLHIIALKSPEEKVRLHDVMCHSCIAMCLKNTIPTSARRNLRAWKKNGLGDP
jgi:hypothetical protein